MARKKKDADSPLFNTKTTTAPCVPALRDAVNKWRAEKYPGATKTTHQLLNYWFEADHRLPDGRRFAYHYSQRHAIETNLILFGADILARRRRRPIDTDTPVGDQLVRLAAGSCARAG